MPALVKTCAHELLYAVEGASAAVHVLSREGYIGKAGKTITRFIKGIKSKKPADVAVKGYKSGQLLARKQNKGTANG